MQRLKGSKVGKKNKFNFKGLDKDCTQLLIKHFILVNENLININLSLRKLALKRNEKIVELLELQNKLIKGD